MNELYRAIGISKQAVSQYLKYQQEMNKQLSVLIKEAEILRENHPGCGLEKMYYILEPDFLGRDHFIEIMSAAGFRLRNKRNYQRTTYATIFNYPNLIKGMEVSAPCIIWQSDITYFAMEERYYYAVFIIDVYTKKIVGHQLTGSLRAEANIAALKMALKTNPAPKIHHSDRGSQYGSKEYVNLLLSQGSCISMAGTAQDNAYAERIHRTIKDEYIRHWKPVSFAQLKRQINKAVYHYNHLRPHTHLKRLAPIEFEKRWHNNDLKTIPTFTIFDNQRM